MRDTTIARNYAETLFALATKADDLRGWGKTINELATAIDQDATLRLFLESPRIGGAEKSRVLGQAFQDRMPRLMVRFLQILVMHRRQNLIPEIAREYLDLVDAAEGRMYARVTVAREASDAEVKEIAAQLSRMFGKDVVPHMSVDPAIMGGVVVNVGDTVLDGSVRKRLATLRRRMLGRSRVG
jgi:F-type H+-transporting ATPase subunit delta